MLAIPLQSGSNGNCTYVEARGVKLLFDAGISGRQAELRLAAFEKDIRQACALLVSHDHADHVRCLGVYHRKFHLPVYATAATIRAASQRCHLGAIGDVRCFQAGDVLDLGGVSVETVPTPHDGADGVAFVVDDGRRRLGILTDLGHVFGGLAELISSLDAVLIESNYDPDMLEGGPYPAFLRNRIKGPTGHISNIEAAELLRAAAGARMKWAALAHLSEQNNDPSLALASHRRIVPKRLAIHLTSRHQAIGPLEV